MEHIELDYPAKRKGLEESPYRRCGLWGSGGTVGTRRRRNVPTFPFGPVSTALATPGKRYWTGSSRSTTEPSAFRSTTLGATPGSVMLRLEQAVEASEQ